MGGREMVRKQHELGKLTARERLDLLFDTATFQEVQLFTKHRSTLFGLGEKDIPAEGVITGFGRVDGRVVFAAAQDFTCSGGSLGEMQAKKIWKVMDMAIAAKKPFVSLNDSGGARIQEGVPALDGYGGIFYRNTLASGYIPQITATMGPTAGGAVYSPALTDWVFMVKRSSYMCITGPDVIKAVIGEEVTNEALGGALVHSTKSGVCHFAMDNDRDCINRIRTLLSYLPDSCHSPLPIMPTSDKPDRECPDLNSIIPDKPSKSYDMKRIILEIADNHEMLEPHALWAKNMIVAFIRIMGCPVGIVANNPRFGAGVLDVSASDKAARFIRFCDAFNIPLLTFADVPGYLPGTRQEGRGSTPMGQRCFMPIRRPRCPSSPSWSAGLRRGLHRHVQQAARRGLRSWPGPPRNCRHGAERRLQHYLPPGDSGAKDSAAKRKELAQTYEAQIQQSLLCRGPGHHRRNHPSDGHTGNALPFCWRP